MNQMGFTTALNNFSYRMRNWIRDVFWLRPLGPGTQGAYMLGSDQNSKHYTYLESEYMRAILVCDS